MQFSDETKALFQGLMNPPRRDLIDLANVPEMGADLALAHIAIMRACGEQVPASLLALEILLVAKGYKAVDHIGLRQSGLLHNLPYKATHNGGGG
jgi:hypothetical protein